jgi:uncharacterized membrane protein
MADVSRIGRGAACALAALTVLGLSCAEPRSTEPDGGAAFARAGGSDPTVVSADPSEAPQDSTLDVHVFGSNYDQGSKVAFARAGVVDPKLHVNATAYVSSAELVANVSVAADAAPVSYDVVVTKSTGKKGIGTELFAVLVPVSLLSAPSGFSSVEAASGDGTLVGRVTTLCGTGLGPALWGQSGTLTVLPTLPGSCGGVVHGINGTGVAVGSAYDASGITNAVRWIPSGGTYVPEALPRLPDGSSAGPWDINEAGSVVGVNTASFWSASGGWQILPRPSGAESCLGEISLNDLNAIVGKCLFAGQQKGVYWPSPTAAPVLLPVASGGTRASPWDINNAGVIVGYTVVGTHRTVNRATRWTPSGSGWTVEFLPDLGAGSVAFAINETGEIAGDVVAKANRPAFWNANGLLRQMEGTGEAVALSGSATGPVVAGYILSGGNKVAASWRP